MQIPQAQPFLRDFPMWLAGTNGEGEAPDNTAVTVQWKKPGAVSWTALAPAVALLNGTWGAQLQPADTAILGVISFRATGPGCSVWKWQDQIVPPSDGNTESNQLDQIINLLTRIVTAERA